MRRILAFIFIITSFASSAFEATQIYGQDDLGDVVFQQFTYSIAIDCENAQLRVIVMDASNTPVENAAVYLQYLENSYQTVSNMQTPENGTTIHQLPGNTSYMRSRWNLLIEKNGYRSKMVQFDLAPCYSDWTPTAYYENDTDQASEINGNYITTSIAQNTSQNSSQNDSGASYDYENEHETSDENVELTWLVFIILIVWMAIIIFKYIKQTKVQAGPRDRYKKFSSAKLYWRQKKQK